MSDARPKRIARAPGRSAVSAAEPAPTEAAAIVPEAIAEDAVAQDAGAAEEAVSVAPERSAQLMRSTVSATRGPSTDSAESASHPADDSPDDPWAMVGEAQATLARGLAALAVEITGMTGAGIAAAGDAAIALVEARTLAEAVEIGAGLARRGVDAMIEGSTRLSEIGVTAVSDASRSILSQPMLSRLGGTRSGVAAD